MTGRRAVRAAVVALAATATLAAGPAPAGADATKLHKTKTEASGTIRVNLNTGELTSVARTKMTHIGKGWLTTRSHESIPIGDDQRYTGSATVVTDDGDLLFGTFTSLVSPRVNGVYPAHFEHTITGGTGKFTGATGVIIAANTGSPFEFPTAESPFLVLTLESAGSGWIRY